MIKDWGNGTVFRTENEEIRAVDDLHVKPGIGIKSPLAASGFGIGIGR
jgi:hypothetical protein